MWTCRLWRVAITGDLAHSHTRQGGMDTPLALMSGWQETGSGQRNVNRSEDTTFRKQLQEQDCSSLFPLPRASHPHQDRVPSAWAPG